MVLWSFYFSHSLWGFCFYYFDSQHSQVDTTNKSTPDNPPNQRKFINSQHTILAPSQKKTKTTIPLEYRYILKKSQNIEYINSQQTIYAPTPPKSKNKNKKSHFKRHTEKNRTNMGFRLTQAAKNHLDLVHAPRSQLL